MYITVPASPAFRQMTLNELLFMQHYKPLLINNNTANTKTVEIDAAPEKYKKDIANMIDLMRSFNKSTSSLREINRRELYKTFYIPKKSGGVRQIDAPKPELMQALRQLKNILEGDFGLLYHTAAFAYVKKRSTVDAVMRHQKNNSNWFAKFDLSNFFGSTTLEFVLKMMSMIYPTAEIMKDSEGRRELEAALELAFLNGGLPQGTPVSPLITNVMMIPIDHRIANELRDFNNQRFVYTRYADDFIVSSKYEFDFRNVEKLINNALAEFEAPFSIKQQKTRYGSSAGSNWNLGIMLNKDNEMTVGHKNKRRFKAMLSSYSMDKLAGNSWDKHDIQVMDGLRSYYRMIEKETIDQIVERLNEKFGMDIVESIRNDLSQN